jgi:ABC-type transport system substrate-binding protein
VPTEYASYRKKRLGFDLPGEMGGLATPTRPLTGFVALNRVLFHSEGRSTSMKDPEMDRIIEQMSSSLDPNKARQIFTKIYRYPYNHYNHLSVIELDVPYATNTQIAQWALGGVVWDQNFLYLVRQH